MSMDHDKQFVGQVRQQLDRHADAIDELTAARLGAARRRALRQRGRKPRYWVPVAGLATAAVALLAVLVLMRTPQTTEPGWELWVAQDDIEVIEELDFYAWLDATQPNS